MASSAAKKLAAWVGKAGGMPPVALIAAVSAVLRSYDAAAAKVEALLTKCSAEGGPDTGDKPQPNDSSSSESSSTDSTTSSLETTSSSSSSSSSRRHGRTVKQERRAVLDRIYAVRLAHVQTLDRLSTLLQRQGSCAACPVIHPVMIMESVLAADMSCVIPGKARHR